MNQNDQKCTRTLAVNTNVATEKRRAEPLTRKKERGVQRGKDPRVEVKHEIFVVVCITVILLTIRCAYAIDVPLEMSISRRMSIHDRNLSSGGYAATAIPSSDLSKVLWAAYGKTEIGRSATTFTDYPVRIYVANITATYKFMPETSSLSLWKTGDYRSIGQGYGLTAPYQLYIIFDTNVGGTTYNDLLFGNAEAGCVMQNIYLMADTLNLGTVCQGMGAQSTKITEGLGLPRNEKPLYKMPLGYLISPYTNYQNLVLASRPSSSALPMIKDSSITLEAALNQVSSSHQWANTDPLTKQELSQVLWASYGYSYYNDTSKSPPVRHRTVPSAFNYYPMHIYAVDSSGVYEYIPLTHTLNTLVTGDRRGSVASASGITWAASAPLIIAVAYLMDERPYIGGQETYVEAGLIAQNVYLESAAWGLMADWSKANTNEAAMRTALGLTDANLHLTSIITIGHSLSAPPVIQSTYPLCGNNTYNTISTISLTAIDEGSGLNWAQAEVQDSAGTTIQLFTKIFAGEKTAQTASWTLTTPITSGSNYKVIFTVENQAQLERTTIAIFNIYTALQGNWYVNDVAITNVNQVVYATSARVSFKFVKTAGSPDNGIAASVKEEGATTLTLPNSAAGTWTGTVQFTTQGRHTLTLTASDGATNVTMSMFTVDFRGPTTIIDWLSENPFIIAVGAILLIIVAVYFIVRRKR